MVMAPIIEAEEVDKMFVNDEKEESNDKETAKKGQWVLATKRSGRVFKGTRN